MVRFLLFEIPKPSLKISLCLLFLFNFPAKAEGVLPKEAQKLKPVEIGEIVLTLMQPKPEKTDSPGNNNPGWDYLADSKIIFWIDDGIVSTKSDNGETGWSRAGYMRIRVDGKKTTVLKNTLKELAWSINYSNNGNPSFGALFIALAPWAKDEPCFGSTYSGCDFDPIKSFQASGISTTKICESRITGLVVRGFKLTHPKKSSVLARITDNYGSGGATTHLELDFWSDKKDFCKIE